MATEKNINSTPDNTNEALLKRIAELETKVHTMNETDANAVSADKKEWKEIVARENARMEEYVIVELFQDNDEYKDDVKVAVNGVLCQIQRGVPVKIKRKYAEVLKNQRVQDAKTSMLIRELSKDDI